MHWRWLLAILLTVGISAFIYRQGGAKRLPGRRSDASHQTSAEPMPPIRIFASGVVEGAQRELGLNFEVPGRIRVVHVREGDQVEEGQILAELDSSAAEIRLFEARAQLKIASTERDRLVASAASSVVRKSEAVGQRSGKVTSASQVTRRDAESARSGRDKPTATGTPSRVSLDELEPVPSVEDDVIADTRVKLAEAEVRMARLVLDQAQLRAPCAGVIVRAVPQPGELTGPDRAPELFTLSDRSHTLVRAHVEEFDALRVSAGQPVKVLVPGRSDLEYAGVVRTCAPWLAPKSQRHFGPGERLDVRVREIVVELTDGSDLLLGLPVEVWIDPEN